MNHIMTLTNSNIFSRSCLDFAFLALAQLTDKMDPMYIILRDQHEPHDDACVICFWVFQSLATRGLKNCFLLALPQLTDKMDPKYIIPK